MSTNLITLSDKSTVMLPPARNEGAMELYKAGRIERLPQWLPDEQMAARFITAVAAEVNGLPKETDPNSIVKTAFNCAVLGLLPGAQLGHAHFITFRMNRGKQNEWLACQLVVGFKGWLELSYGCGFLKDVHCEVVLKGEEFDRWVDTDGAQIYHDIPIDRDEAWGNVDAAYCVWHATTGGHGAEVVPRKELDKLKRRGNVWNSAPIEMAKKTPILRASKTWKRTGVMAQAAVLDEHAERDEVQPYVGDKPIDDDSDTPTPKLEQFDVPSDEDKEAAESRRRFEAHDSQLRSATLKAALDMALSEVQSDDRLSQAHRDALEATYRECREKFAD